MQICKRCLYNSSHPLNLVFDDEGVCSGCRIHDEKGIIDWDVRSQKLKNLLNNYRSNSRRNYDCIIPVSGGRDSYFIVHMVKNVFGMNPLLVSYNKQYNTAVGIRNLSNLRIKFDCDILIKTCNPKTVKKITRGSLRNFGSIYWHCIAGQTVFPVQVAVKLKIPLIIWGAHQGIDQVGMFSHLDEVEMTRKYRKEHDLMGFEAEDLINQFDEISEGDVMPYVYPDNVELERIGVRGIYLNNFIRWDSKTQHEKMIALYGYETVGQSRTFDAYRDIDCWNYSDLHDYIKYIKNGYGVALDHACRDIRLGHITRNQGKALVEKYSSIPMKNENLFLEWIGMTRNSLNYILDQHRNPDLWVRSEKWNWELRGGLENNKELRPCHSNNHLDNGGYILTDKKHSVDDKQGYILVGRGL